MSVCNLFHEINKSSGNFMLFSQYAEDLAKMSAGSIVNATPSKFMAFDVDFSNFNRTYAFGPAGYTQQIDLNKSIPVFLQRRFENACSYIKDNINGYTPDTSRILFWQMMIKSGLLNIEGESKIKELMYIGDINIQSYNTVEGMGYSEIYCHIPSDAKQTVYNIAVKTGTDTVSNTSIKLQGYTTQPSHSLDINSGATSSSAMVYDKKELFEFLDQSTAAAVDHFNINMIVVFYNVKMGADVVYKNIPLGIYFPGVFSGSTMTNEITKYVSNTGVYNTGSSYGFRICSRFTPSLLWSDNQIIIDDSSDDAKFSQVMTEMSKTLRGMTDVVSNIHNCCNNLKDTLAIFKNGRTNVPYILNIDGTNYWYVNGRMIGTVEGAVGKLTLSATIPSQTRYKGVSTNINITWSTMVDGELTPASSIYIYRDSNLIKEYANTSNDVYTDSGISDSCTYKIVANYGDQVKTKEIYVRFSELAVSLYIPSGSYVKGLSHNIPVTWNTYLDGSPVKVDSVELYRGSSKISTWPISGGTMPISDTYTDSGVQDTCTYKAVAKVGSLSVEKHQTVTFEEAAEKTLTAELTTPNGTYYKGTSYPLEISWKAYLDGTLSDITSSELFAGNTSIKTWSSASNGSFTHTADNTTTYKIVVKNGTQTKEISKTVTFIDRPVEDLTITNISLSNISGIPGESNPNASISWTVKQGSSTVIPDSMTLSYMLNGESKTITLNDTQKTNGKYTWNDFKSNDYLSTVTFTLSATKDSKSATGSKSITFNKGRLYHGQSGVEDLDGAITYIINKFNNDTSDIIERSTRKIVFNDTEYPDYRMHIAYPAYFGSYTSLLDQNDQKIIAEEMNECNATINETSYKLITYPSENQTGSDIPNYITIQF